MDSLIGVKITGPDETSAPLDQESFLQMQSSLRTPSVITVPVDSSSSRGRLLNLPPTNPNFLSVDYNRHAGRQKSLSGGPRSPASPNPTSTSRNVTRRLSVSATSSPLSPPSINLIPPRRLSIPINSFPLSPSSINVIPPRRPSIPNNSSPLSPPSINITPPRRLSTPSTPSHLSPPSNHPPRRLSVSSTAADDIFNCHSSIVSGLSYQNSVLNNSAYNSHISLNTCTDQQSLSPEPLLDPLSRRLSWEINTSDYYSGYTRDCDTYSNIITPAPRYSPLWRYSRSEPAAPQMTSNLPECFFRFLVITTFLAVYMCIGAAIFCEIEREQEKAHSEKMKEHWKKFQEENEISEEMMNKFLVKHYDMCEQGDHNHADNNVQWDYISSLFFTGTILTTIGYGHSSPSTLGGRLFTIFYAIAGIPFMLGLSNVVAEILLTTLKIMKSKWKKKPYPDVFHFEVFISALCCVVILLVFMTLIFKWQESEWSYEQSIYFSFITMTTIGFGDFVPAQVNVQNNSPQLITREFFNLLLILISVLIWYFLSQVSAQVLKVRLKALHQYLRNSSSLFNKTDNYPEVEANHHVDPDSDDPEIGPDRCTCNCTCGYHDHMTDSASGILDTHSAVSERSGMDPHPMNNLGCIKDNDDTHQEDDDDDGESSCSDSSSENSASHHNINFVPQSDSVAEPPDASLKIPSIVITPVDPNAKSSNNSLKTNPAYSTLLKSETRDHPYDSGKGSSEITTYTCHTNDISNPKTPSQSSSSLSTNSSGVFSDSHSKAGVYVNGGFIPSLPRMKRSKSEEVGSSSFISLNIGNKGLRRISRSLTDLGFGNKPYRYLSEQKLNSNSIDYNGEVDTFSIHTQVFDDMMKS